MIAPPRGRARGDSADQKKIYFEQYKTVRLACVWLYLIVIAPCYNISVTLGSLPYCDRASRVPVNTKEFYYE